MCWCIDPEGQYKFIWGKIPRELKSTYSKISALDLQIVNLYPKVKWLGNLDLVLNMWSWGKWVIDVHICDWDFSVLDYKVACMETSIANLQFLLVQGWWVTIKFSNWGRLIYNVSHICILIFNPVNLNLYVPWILVVQASDI
jgi:hypothetical protein